MPFPLLISLRESLLELCSALPEAGPLGTPCHATARLLPLWVCKAIAAHSNVCKSRQGTRHTSSVAITASLWGSAVGLEPFAPHS